MNPRGVCSLSQEAAVIPQSSYSPLPLLISFANLAIPFQRFLSDRTSPFSAFSCSNASSRTSRWKFSSRAAGRVPLFTASCTAQPGPRLPLHARPASPRGFSGKGWGLPSGSGAAKPFMVPLLLPKAPSVNFPEPQKRRHRPDSVYHPRVLVNYPQVFAFIIRHVLHIVLFSGNPGRRTLISGKSYEKIVQKKDPGNDPQVAQVARQRRRDLIITALSKCNTKED